ncbi:MAG TPA: carboxymuconolactone decarboxylase family protein [Jatrophihabitans sp.]|jgi:AhpD family alkylhydroperoxidase
MTTTLVQARMTNPVMVIDGAMAALTDAHNAALSSGLARELSYLVEVRASQINGCSYCVEMHARELKSAGVPEEKIWAVGAWRESPHFTADERAALALTECMTRLADRSDPVSDEVFDEAARHFDTVQLSGLIMEIALINVWNRINVTVRQPAGRG